MAKRAVPFFLPVRREVLTALIGGRELPTARAELAVIMAITLLRRTPDLTVQQVERALFDVQELLAKDPVAGADQVQAAWSALGPVSMDDLEELLASRNLVFTPSSRMPYADEPIERYESTFQQDMQVPMQSVEVPVLPTSDDESDEEDYYEESRPPRPVVALTGSHQQMLAVRTIVAMLDEHIDADAYAGTGKTHLVMALAASAPGAFTYITPFDSQMHGGVQAAGQLASTLRKKTLADLARDAAKPFVGIRGALGRKFGPGEVQPSERARLSGINRIGSHTAAQVVGLAERAITNWCNSDSPRIQPLHFKRVLSRFIDVTPYILAAEALWATTWAPGKNSRPFTLHLHYLVKWLNLQDAPIPRSYGTLLVDEAHDLMPSWRHFLDRYPGGCIFLGDPYQRLSGRIPRHGRNKMLVMNQSFRMGLQGDDAIRRTLESAPEKRVIDLFAGSRSHITRVRQERQRTGELHEGLRVYANEWALLEDAQRLKNEGGRFRVLPATLRNLRKLVIGASTLYNQPESTWQVHAGGYRTWAQFAAAQEKDGRTNVVRMFERGYNLSKFQEMEDSQAAEGQQRITLGLVAHVKNLESSTVTLNECCFTEAQARHGHEPAHAVYLAMSRVRDELWLPRDAFDRLAELKAEPAEPWELPLPA